MENVNSITDRTEKLLKHISTVKVDELDSFTEDVFNECEVSYAEVAKSRRLRKNDSSISNN